MEAFKSLLYRRPILAVSFTSIVVFLLPLLWRLMKGNTTLIGEYPYYYLSQLPFALPFVVWWVGMILLSLVAVFLFYRLVRMHVSNPLIRVVSTLLFVITPALVYLSFSVSPYLFAVILLLAGLNLLHSERSLLAWVLLGLLLLFDWLTFLSSFIIVSGYLMFIDRKMLLSRFVPAALLVFIAVHLVFSRPFAFEVFYQRLPLIDFFSDFESIHGVGMFVFLLAVIGFMLSWSEKKRYFALYTSVLFLLVLFGAGNVHALVFLSPFLAISAASAFVYFWQRQWVFSSVRFLTLIVLMYGVLFSTLSYVNRVTGLPPSPAVFDSLAGLDGTVLTHPSNSFWIMYADGEPYITYLDADYEQRLNVTLALLRSRDLRRTQMLVESLNATYIWADAEMREGQVWENKDDGFLFLSKRYPKVYNEDGIEVWKVG